MTIDAKSFAGAAEKFLYPEFSAALHESAWPERRIIPGKLISRYNVRMAFRAGAPAFGKKPTKTPPPDDTGMEAGYLKALGEKQTPVAVKLLSGETFRGWVEYYDSGMIRLTREGAPNLFIFKHEIMYIAEDTGRRAR